MRWTRGLWAPALAAVLLCTLVSVAGADVRVPKIFGSHMVLQRDMAIPVWGWADAGEKVSVQLGAGPAVRTTANDQGQWKVSLAPVPAGGPFTMTVAGNNQVVFDDVLVGEVWLCSGQSNMEMTVSSSNNFPEEQAAANYPRIRQIKVGRAPKGFPVDDITGDWKVCAPDTVGAFTAAGYFFAREITKALDVPVGLINSSWGGTAIEPWTPPVGFAQVPALDGIYKRVQLTNPASDTYKASLGAYIAATETWLGTAKAALAGEKPLDPSPAYPNELKPFATERDPTALFNGMIAPLIPYAIRGALWYQGETNHWDGMLYVEKTKALIAGWRKLWGQGDFPYYYVQIAPYVYGNEDPEVLARFWEAQAAIVSAVPNAAMASTQDIGDVKDIHPKNKQEVGRRLALLALNKTYHLNDVVCDNPTFKSMNLEGNALRVTFDNVGSGLVSRDGKPLTWFEIIGKDTDFVAADARIEGNSVVLTSAEVREPVAVRFAWHRLAEPNLSNKEGLPALPFRAGEVPKRDWLTLKIPEAKDYRLVYDLDITKAAHDIKYDVDDHAKITAPFDRIGYFLELTKSEGTQYVWVSMDAFTQDASKIGVPTVASGARFQQPVNNMTVMSNLQGLASGTGLTGNLEFWPDNYGQNNAAGVAGASSQSYDFGDQPSAPADGYGSMQVGNPAAKQTVFAFNHWSAGAGADLGIGNSSGQNPDWTFAGNAGQYSARRLRVLVRMK
jgi:sialate O-acetylesterase